MVVRRAADGAPRTLDEFGKGLSVVSTRAVGRVRAAATPSSNQASCQNQCHSHNAKGGYWKLEAQVGTPCHDGISPPAAALGAPYLLLDARGRLDDSDGGPAEKGGNGP